MEIFGDKSVITDKPFITIGNFDGVHKGHHYLFEELKNMAMASRGKTAVVTFHPLPACFFKPDLKHHLLTSLELKIEFILRAGIDAVVVQSFDEKFSQLSPDEFCFDWLQNTLAPQGLVIGYDFKFGKNRVGDYQFLSSAAKKLNWLLSGLEAPFCEKNQVVSSSAIRKFLKEGDLLAANNLLGRSFCLQGVVTEGQKRGRLLGFPTANLILDSSLLLPCFGVYACRIDLPEKGILGKKAIVNCGVRPSVDSSLSPLVEVHIFDFQEEIYGEKLVCYFEHFIRPEQKFSSLDDLKAQIKKDILFTQSL